MFSCGTPILFTWINTRTLILHASEKLTNSNIHCFIASISSIFNFHYKFYLFLNYIYFLIIVVSFLFLTWRYIYCIKISVICEVITQLCLFIWLILQLNYTSLRHRIFNSHTIISALSNLYSSRRKNGSLFFK